MLIPLSIGIDAILLRQSVSRVNLPLIRVNQGQIVIVYGSLIMFAPHVLGPQRL